MSQVVHPQIRIPDLDPDFLPIPGSKRHRLPDPDPQHSPKLLILYRKFLFHPYLRLCGARSLAGLAAQILLWRCAEVGGGLAASSSRPSSSTSRPPVRLADEEYEVTLLLGLPEEGKTTLGMADEPSSSISTKPGRIM